jgi:hypothetical protein
MKNFFGKIKNLPIFIGGILFFLIVVLYVLSYALTPKVYQPIKYSHYIHVKKNELSCDICHQYYEEEMFAGKPKIETCAMCHSSSISKSPEEKKVVQYVKKGKEIPWKKIYKFKNVGLFKTEVNVFFSHQRHIVFGKVKCKTCHGDMESMKTPPKVPLVKISMNRCINCHKKKKVTTSCNACHR